MPRLPISKLGGCLCWTFGGNSASVQGPFPSSFATVTSSPLVCSWIFPFCQVGLVDLSPGLLSQMSVVYQPSMRVWNSNEWSFGFGFIRWSLLIYSIFFWIRNGNCYPVRNLRPKNVLSLNQVTWGQKPHALRSWKGVVKWWGATI